jgi:KUP system potassium uptake protein
VTDLVPSEDAAEDGVADEAPSGRRRTAARGLMLAALGVVFGDIGTSPLYAMQTVFSLDNGMVRATRGDVFGVVSLVFWSITIVVSVKYVIFILRADNDGEGGVMALAALVRSVLRRAGSRRTGIVMGLGVLGASLFYGDSVITPAISVLSAVEGVEVVTPRLSEFVVPAAAAILALLFVVQRWGTDRVGSLFGPVMLLWFAAMAANGLPTVVRHPDILLGLSPTFAVEFVADHPYTAFIAMGAVVLAITGAEALYADLGHFGPSPIRRSWFLIVFPALTISYLAQGALIVADPSARANPFFLLVPSWAQIPMVIMATAATVIASQAVISGAFSVSKQAVRLGFLPHLQIRHTSSTASGQVYVPAVNGILFIAVLAVTFAFGSSTRLATAYGIAVTGTFLITTTLFLVIAKLSWRWPTWRLVVMGIVFGGIEITFFAANLTKVPQGGWLTLLIAAVIFTIMTTWQRGREIVTERRIELEGRLEDFVDTLHSEPLPRVSGTAVFPHPTERTTPLALRVGVDRFRVLHERVVIICGRTTDVPHLPWSQRLTIEHIGDPEEGIIHVAAEFGFQDRTDFPEVLRRLSRGDAPPIGGVVDSDDATYFLSGITLMRSRRPGMSTWRKCLFIVMARNAASQAEAFHLPLDRTIVAGAEIDI